MSCDDYHHANVVGVIRDTLLRRLNVTCPELLEEVMAPMRAKALSEFSQGGVDGLMTQALANHPVLLQRWQDHRATLRKNPAPTIPKIVPGLMEAPEGFRPLDNPDRWLDTLKSL